MIDIDELTGHELNRAIAEALGYAITDQWVDPPDLPVKNHDTFDYALVTREGLVIDFIIAETVDDAWLELWAYQGPHADDRPFPDWSHDLNAAIALPMDEYYIAKHREFGIQASVNFSFFGDGNTPAIAVCRAWLKYRAEHAAARDPRDHEGRGQL